jgi:hypothetical protein
MGGLTFGGGYFGQYSQGGTPPVEFAAQADLIVRVDELVAVVEMTELAGTVRVGEITGTVTV